jgi:5'-nucleotidase (lipoprotein e(P4) family)
MSKLNLTKSVIYTLLSLAFLVPVALGQTAGTSMGRQATANNEYQVAAILWTQSSAEYRAIAYQTFSLAKLRLDVELSKRSGRQAKSAAVIVDADETVLDNSRFQAELVLRSIPYTSANWQSWCDRAEAGAVPGAVGFLKYAARRGVRVFYITNRREGEKAGTMQNLMKLGFPNVTQESVMIRDQGSSKEARREKVRAKHSILLLVGDNLNDFTDDFSNKSIADRSAEVDRQRAEFGSRFIILPNPMYGDWESSINHNQSNLTEEQREANRRAALKGFNQ